MKIQGRDFGARTTHYRVDYDLDTMVAEIARHVPRMRSAAASEAEFLHWFQGEMDSVRRNARTPEHWASLRTLLEGSLSEPGRVALRTPTQWRDA